MTTAAAGGISWPTSSWSPTRQPQSRLQSYDWLDWGRDFYAGVTYDNAPDNKRIMIAWMNNWDYANQIPTGQWRSAMALPRELTLETINGKPKLVQKVVDQIGNQELPAQAFTQGPGDITEGSTPLPAQANGSLLKVDAVFSPGTASKFGLAVRQSADGSESTPVLYNTENGRLTIDRTHSGDVSFSPAFASVESAPVALENGKLHLELYLDRASVEAFAQDGKQTITDQIFPAETSTGLSLLSEGGTARLESLTVTPLKPAMWQQPQEQTITFGPLAAKRLGDPDFPVTATASSGLPVTFTACRSMHRHRRQRAPHRSRDLHHHRRPAGQRRLCGSNSGATGIHRGTTPRPHPGHLQPQQRLRLDPNGPGPAPPRSTESPVTRWTCRRAAR